MFLHRLFLSPFFLHEHTIMLRLPSDKREFSLAPEHYLEES